VKRELISDNKDQNIGKNGARGLLLNKIHGNNTVMWFKNREKPHLFHPI
jgi:hypothetical protein